MRGATCFYIGPYIRLAKANCFISEREIGCVGLKQYRHDTRHMSDPYSGLAIGLTTSNGGLVVTGMVNKNVPINVMIDSDLEKKNFMVDYYNYIENLRSKFDFLEIEFGIVPFYCSEQEAIWYGSSMSNQFAE